MFYINETILGYMKSRFVFGHAQSAVGMVAPDHPFQRKSANFRTTGAVVPT